MTQSYTITTKVTPQHGHQDSNVPQWLSFNFESKRKIFLHKVILQDVVVYTPGKRKKVKTIHHFTRSESRELMANITTSMHRKEGGEQTSTG